MATVGAGRDGAFVIMWAAAGVERTLVVLGTAMSILLCEHLIYQHQALTKLTGHYNHLVYIIKNILHAKGCHTDAVFTPTQCFSFDTPPPGE